MIGPLKARGIALAAACAAEPFVRVSGFLPTSSLLVRRTFVAKSLQDDVVAAQVDVKKGLQAIKDATSQSLHKTALSDIHAAKEKEEREEDLRLEEVARAESLVRATREVATAVKGVCAALTRIASRLDSIEEVYTHVVSSLCLAARSQLMKIEHENHQCQHGPC